MHEAFQAGAASSNVNHFISRYAPAPHRALQHFSLADSGTSDAISAFGTKRPVQHRFQRRVRQNRAQTLCRTVFRGDQEVVFPDPSQSAQERNGFMRQRRFFCFHIEKVVGQQLRVGLRYGSIPSFGDEPGQCVCYFARFIFGLRIFVIPEIIVPLDPRLYIIRGIGYHLNIFDGQRKYKYNGIGEPSVLLFVQMRYVDKTYEFRTPTFQFGFKYSIHAFKISLL